MSAREAGREMDALIAEQVMGMDLTSLPKHEWKTDEDGSIDTLAYYQGDYHNGPQCVRCGYGFCHHCEPDSYADTPCVKPFPAYSQNIYAAWLVVDKMRAAGFVASVSDMPGESIVRATASFATTPLLPTHDEYGACAETVPLAICRAALAAVGVAA